MEQVPGDVSVTRFPLTVQTPGVAEVKVMPSPEVEPAVTVTGLELSGVLLRGAKLIVCGVPGAHAVNVLPVIVVPPELTKAGMLDAALVGARLTVAVMGVDEALIVPAPATR